eukprot:gnl/MRDRNA2_/MRDRNA2_65836_c0_seq1.p1 gnl/MRDRNA2_/MRDRNA2_65836_c0~~gnl/MRDRNA2_/MRDRNA2_65836_c0_seq1.p1  ORF type:complete len:521 (+),score=87.79 gnl/MRDRNA2_/MRDRNA2_65836_c0_seq1:182-1744(+)
MSGGYNLNTHSNVSVKNTFLHIDQSDNEGFPSEFPEAFSTAGRRASSSPPNLGRQRRRDPRDFFTEDSSNGNDSAVETVETVESWETYQSYPTSDALMPVTPDYDEEDDDDDHGARSPDSKTQESKRWCDISDRESDHEKDTPFSTRDIFKSSSTDESPQSSSESYTEYTGPITTMMIRNIPCRCTTEKVLADINDMGYRGTYNFFYLPQTRKRTSNLGYAFINFKTAEAAEDFQRRMSGHKFSMNARNSKSQKICCVAPAALQGYENTKKHFLATNANKSMRAPCFFAESDDDVQNMMQKSPSEEELSPAVEFENTMPMTYDLNDFAFEAPISNASKASSTSGPSILYPTFGSNSSSASLNGFRPTFGSNASTCSTINSEGRTCYYNSPRRNHKTGPRYGSNYGSNGSNSSCSTNACYYMPPSTIQEFQERMQANLPAPYHEASNHSAPCHEVSNHQATYHKAPNHQASFWPGNNACFVPQSLVRDVQSAPAAGMPEWHANGSQSWNASSSLHGARYCL